MAISQKCPLPLEKRGRNLLICLPSNESLACLRQLWRPWRLAKLLVAGLIFAGILVGSLPVFEPIKGQGVDLGSISESLNQIGTRPSGSCAIFLRTAPPFLFFEFLLNKRDWANLHSSVLTEITKGKRAGVGRLGLVPIWSNPFSGKKGGRDFNLLKFRDDKLATIEGNSLLPIVNSFNPEPEKARRIRAVITGYSSTVDQTDSDPFITAAGTIVRDGIVATNILSFGTKIKLPELYGDKIFVVEDRMYWNKKYHIDIWFPTREEALQFGVKITDALIISN